MRLTDRVAKAVKAPAAGHHIAWDDELKGFGLRVTAAGARSFIVDYRIDGRQRRMTLGQFPDWSVTAARDEAKRIKRDVDLGNDPMGVRHVEREAPTVEDLVARYIKDVLPKKRPETQRQYQALLKQFVLPRLGKLKVATVRHADIDALHREVSRHAPYRANRTVAVVSKLFNLAIRWEMRPDNPAKGIERNPEEKRSRYLTPEELARLTEALAQHHNQQSANAVRLLVLTGARRGEVLGATWDQFDLAAGVWTKGSAHTKQKKEHRVPLSAPARQLLAALRQTADGPYLFPGEAEDTHQTELKHFWATLCKRADLEEKKDEKGRVVRQGVRVHDLRHTYASILASAGLSLPIVGALLGHTQPGTTARYTHLYDDPLRAATERVGALVSGAGKAEVVSLMKGKR